MAYELRCRFNHPTRKVYKDDHDFGFSTYQALLPKNGTDGFNVTIWTNDPAEDLTFHVESPISETGEVLAAEAFLLHALPVRNRPLPDAMLPNLNTFSTKRNDSPSFFVRISASKEASAGIYTGAFRVEKDGEVLNRLEFSAKVWDFTLPDVPACGTLFGLSKAQIQKAHSVSDEEADALYKTYFDFLLENKICADDLPYDLLDVRADAYLNDPRVTHFRIPYAQEDATILAYRAKLAQNPAWLQKGLFYPVDEPSEPSRLELFRQAVTRLEALWPDFKIITPLGDSRLFPEGYDNISFLGTHQTHWCLRSDMFGANGTAGYVKDELSDPARSIPETFGTVLTRMAAERAKGRKTWWYVCGFPYMKNYCDLNMDNTGAQHRILFWQQFALNLEGLLYWSVNYWGMEGSPWHNPFTFDKTIYGDGSLLYNGNEIGIHGPVGSLRLEMVRAGIDDFEMLTMAKSVLSETELEAITYPLINPSPALNQAVNGTNAPDVFVFNDDDNAFYSARSRLGDALEAALK